MKRLLVYSILGIACMACSSSRYSNERLYRQSERQLRDSAGRDSSSLLVKAGDIQLQLDVLRERGIRATLQQDSESQVKQQKKATKPASGFSWLLWFSTLLLLGAWWVWKKFH